VNEQDVHQPEEIDPPEWAVAAEGPLQVEQVETAESLPSGEESHSAIVEAPPAPETQVEAIKPSGQELSEQPETLTPQKLYSLGVLSPSAVDRICAEEAKTEFLIEGFLPAKSIAIVGGDSGIGKSPLICQLALCLAAGIPFLGLETHQGRVLYFDLENSLVDCKAMRDALTGFLGLREAPYQDFLLVPEPADFTRLNELIEKLKPRLIVIDSLRALAPHATEKNAAAGEWLKEIRRLVRKYGCAFLIVHHLRKPKLENSPSDLAEETRAMDWLLEMEGPRAFVNQTDVRIAVANGDGKLVALKAKWSRRVRGDSPLYLLERVFEEGEPVGYRPLMGRDFLNPEQRKALDKLPNDAEWGFKEARQALGEAISVDNPALPAPPNRTGEFLQKSIHYQVIEKLTTNRYRKVQKPGVAGVKP
jgi:hypothetical protein